MCTWFLLLCRYIPNTVVQETTVEPLYLATNGIEENLHDREVSFMKGSNYMQELFLRKEVSLLERCQGVMYSRFYQFHLHIQYLSDPDTFLHQPFHFLPPLVHGHHCYNLHQTIGVLAASVSLIRLPFLPLGHKHLDVVVSPAALFG